jgi:hypothetical protein
LLSSNTLLSDVRTRPTLVEVLSTQEIFARAVAAAEPKLPPAMAQQALPLTNLAVKRLLATRMNANQPQARNSFQVAPSRIPATLQTVPATEVAPDDRLPSLLDGDDSDDDSDDDDDDAKGTPLHHSPVCRSPTKRKRPRLTKSMNPRFFEKSLMGKAWKAQKKQFIANIYDGTCFAPHHITCFETRLSFDSRHAQLVGSQLAH